MNQIDVLWDRLAGYAMTYVDNYELAKCNGGKFKPNPSYNVDYEIPEAVLSYIQSTRDKGLKELWYMKIAGCRNINELPEQLQVLLELVLPRFYADYPDYENESCLRK
ncbi:hypothetical protein AALA24_02175 [Anaerovoracaceae bacterium 42-11]